MTECWGGVVGVEYWDWGGDRLILLCGKPRKIAPNNAREALRTGLRGGLRTAGQPSKIHDNGYYHE